MKKKMLALGLSLCVLTSVCIPGTLVAKAAAQSSLACEKEEHIDMEEHIDTEVCLLDRLSDCTTMDELFAMMDEVPDNEEEVLTQEDFDQINKRIAELMSTYTPEPLDPVKMEEKVIFPTVNFTNAAPFGDPVTGQGGRK